MQCIEISNNVRENFLSAILYQLSSYIDLYIIHSINHALLSKKYLIISNLANYTPNIDLTKKDIIS